MKISTSQRINWRTPRLEGGTPSNWEAFSIRPEGNNETTELSTIRRGCREEVQEFTGPCGLLNGKSRNVA